MWDTPTAGSSLDARHTQALPSAAGHSYLTQLLNLIVNTQNVDQHVSLPQSFSRQKQYQPAATLRNKLKPADATRYAYFTLPMQPPAGSYSTVDQR
ncbi:hypothetical protein F511_19968 [Dorcoceras hygrometricum]|uniref:Uncharacterized protein n=1 Tax=Dorcoceras hygrometricum TaxID=472368 RepID=A0A2Z7C1B5_9LAMI|nr:hypothetical protein F511_19968 [Dorcoceras hygrometricum]